MIQAGADDYMIKQHSLSVLIVRIHAVARRCSAQLRPEPVQDFGRPKVGFSNRKFELDGEAVELTEQKPNACLISLAGLTCCCRAVT